MLPPNNNPVYGGFPGFPHPEGVFTTLSMEQLEDEYKNGLVYQENHYYKVYADPELKHLFDTRNDTLHEVIITAYRNEKSKEFDNIKIRVFVHKDGVKLLQQYKKVIVYDNELALFIELDDKYNVNGSVLRLKAGSGVEKVENLPMKEILDFAKQQAVNVDAKSLKKLLKQAHRSKKGFFYWFMDYMTKVMKSISSVPLYLTEALTGILADAFSETLPGLLNSLRLKEEDWNPIKQNYDPFFIPQIVIDTINQNQQNDKVYDQLIVDFFKPFHLLQIGIMGGSIMLGTLGQMPVQHKKLTITMFDSFFEQIFAIENYFKQNKKNFWQVLQISIEAVNALFVGFYNSVIDTLKGISQLIGLIFSGIHTLMQPGEVSYYTELAGEMLENLSEKISHLNFTQIYQEFIKFGIQAFEKIKELSGDLLFSIYEIAYFLGYLAGFVVETIISLLLTGGALTVEQVLTETFVAPLTSLFKGLSKTLSKAKSLFEKIYIFVKKVLEKLKNPKQAMRELFEVIDAMFRINKRKKVYIKNKYKIGKQFNRVEFTIIDKSGKVVGKLVRTVSNKGRRLIYKFNDEELHNITMLLNRNMALDNGLDVLQYENIILGDFSISKNVTDKISGLGNIMLDDALKYYQKNKKFNKVDGIFGYWIRDANLYSEYGGQSINLKQFWKAVDEGATYEEAAFKTFTGKWAEKNEFSKIVLKEIRPENVIIKFKKDE